MDMKTRSRTSSETSITVDQGCVVGVKQWWDLYEDPSTYNGKYLQDLANSIFWEMSIIQGLDGEEARFVDYFDVISGTSTGGLIVAMLTAQDKDVEDVFYLKHSPKFFPQPRYEVWLMVKNLRIYMLIRGREYRTIHFVNHGGKLVIIWHERIKF